LFDTLKTMLADNPLIAGGATMALVGWLMVQARTIPMKIITFIRLQFSTTMTIYSEDNIFRHVDLWLARHPDAKHSRRFGVANWHDRTRDEDDYAGFRPAPAAQRLALLPGQPHHRREGQ